MFRAKFVKWCRVGNDGKVFCGDDVHTNYLQSILLMYEIILHDLYINISINSRILQTWIRLKIIKICAKYTSDKSRRMLLILIHYYKISNQCSATKLFSEFPQEKFKCVERMCLIKNLCQN